MVASIEETSPCDERRYHQYVGVSGPQCCHAGYGRTSIMCTAALIRLTDCCKYESVARPGCARWRPVFLEECIKLDGV